MFSIDNEYKKLTRIDCFNYSSVTFDGCFYYFTMVCKLLIVKMDTDFNIVRVYDTYKKYDKIIYDPVLECFWATRDKGCRYIYKLNKIFIEIDDICVTQYKGSGRITGLSYDCMNDKLIVTFPQAIVSVNKTSGTSELLETSYENWYSDIMCIYPYFLAFTVSPERARVLRYKMEDDALTLINTHDLPLNFNITGLTFSHITDEVKEDEDVEVTLEILKLYDCESYLVTKIATFEEICSCNWWVNDAKCCCDCDCTCKCKCCCKEEICSLIESVALAETAIAHILNAEGEKIQYAVANATDNDEPFATNIKQLVKVNNSVSDTVEKITELEQLIIKLLDKM